MIQERRYVRLDDRKFFPTELGTLVVDKLVEHFREILELDFTAAMEKNLDEIEDGARAWTEGLRAFNDPFTRELNKAKVEMESEKGQEASGELCEKCGKAMLVRRNKHGRFLGCSGYPECKSTRPLDPEEATGETCELCQAPMRIKAGPRGRFLGCTKYPECRGTRPLPRGKSRVQIPAGWKEDCARRQAAPGALRAPGRIHRLRRLSRVQEHEALPPGLA